MIRKKRSIPMTVLLGLLAAGCLALAVYLAIVIVPQAKGAWLGVAVFGLLGAFLLLGAIGAVVQEADCPGCGRALSLSGEEGERIACNQCYALAERRGEGLIALSDEFVSPATDVGLWLLPGMKIPGVCVACGAPATRFEEMRSTKVEAGAAIATLAGSLLAGGLTIATPGVSRAKVGIPYCDAHHDAHELQYEEGTFSLWVRSWRFVRALAAANAQMLLTLHGARKKSK